MMRWSLFLQGSDMAAQASLYDKLFLAFDKQVALLEMRGLLVSDKTAACRFLASTNYYRFTGYAIPFLRDNDREHFKAGVDFEQVCGIIGFDGALRDLVARALRAIEIDFRTTVAHEHSRSYGAMGYQCGRNFSDARAHREMWEKIQGEIENSKEKCIDHFNRNYGGSVPVWAAVEVISFGKVSHLCKAMKDCDKNRVAKRYYLNSKNLCSYIQHLSVVRNACAHHARLWDRDFSLGKRGYGFQPVSEWVREGISATDTRFLFHTLALIYRMARPVPKPCFDRDKWKGELICLLESQRDTPHCDTFREMGIPGNWLDGGWWV